MANITIKVETKNGTTIAGPFETLDKAYEVANRFAGLKSTVSVVIVNGNEEITVKEVCTMKDTIQELIKLVSQYDRYTDYIDNYRQQKQAEERNQRIEAAFVETAATLGIEVSHIDFFNITRPLNGCTAEDAVHKFLKEKEENTMAAMTNTSTNNAKEETVMTNTLATRIIDMSKAERLVYVRDCLINVVKTTDELYINKEELAQFLFDNDIIGRSLGKNELKKTKRQELVDVLNIAVENLIKTGVITPLNTVEVVPTGDFTYDKAPEHDAKYEARAKTDKLFGLLKACAADNAKKGFGYVISMNSLKICITEAGADSKEARQHVYAWLKEKGFIKPVVYSVNEDENIRVYTNEYKGKTWVKGLKMIPLVKAKGYTAKSVVTFLVTIK